LFHSRLLVFFNILHSTQLRAASSSDIHGSFPNLTPILLIYEFLTKLPSSVHIDTFLRHRTKESTRKMCRLVHFQSDKSHKTCRVPTFIGIGTVSIIATLMIPILWSESKQWRKHK